MGDHYQEFRDELATTGRTKQNQPPQNTKVKHMKQIKKGARLSLALREEIAANVELHEGCVDRSVINNKISQGVNLLVKAIDWHFQIDYKNLLERADVGGLFPSTFKITLEDVTFDFGYDMYVPQVLIENPSRLISDENTPDLYKLIVDLHQAKIAYKTKWAMSYDRLMVYMGGFTSIKDLLTQSPELEDFVPERCFEHPVGLTLNQILAA